MLTCRVTFLTFECWCLMLRHRLLTIDLALSPMYSGSDTQNKQTSSEASLFISGYLSVRIFESTSETEAMQDLKISGYSFKISFSMTTISNLTSSLVSGKGITFKRARSTSTILWTESFDNGPSLSRASSVSFKAFSRTKSTSSAMQNTRFFST